MTVATTLDFKPPGVTSCVAHLIKFIKIVNTHQAQLEGCKTFQSQSAPLKKSNNYHILPVTQVLQLYDLVTVSHSI